MPRSTPCARSAFREDLFYRLNVLAIAIPDLKDRPADIMLLAESFLIKHANDSVVARLNLSAMPDLLTVLSGRESSVRRLDELRAEVGDAPADWLPRLTGSRR